MPQTRSGQDDTVTTGTSYPVARERHSGPVLAATDGTVAGETAFRVALGIASTLSVKVRVVVVVEPLPLLVPQPSVIMQPLVASPELLNITRDRIVAEFREIAPESAEWTVDVDYGKPSAEIVDNARRCDAQLIVIGLVHHGVVDRILDGDTALEVVRQSDVPVLLAAETWRVPPKKAVVAVDFSAQSMHAARAALRLLGEGATVLLAHVRPMPSIFDGTGIWMQEYEEAAEQELAKFSKALEAPAGFQVRTVVLRGSPWATLLRLADSEDADLIAAGTRGAGFINRMLLGSVATRLMRHASRSVLIVPASEELSTSESSL
jgi:nucleotide-binding universal stress UspA family protein